MPEGRGGLRGPYGPEGAEEFQLRRAEWARRQKTPAKERRQRIEALLASEEWQLVDAGIRAQRRATMEKLATGLHLSEPEMRALQGQVEFMTDILTRPIEFLIQQDDPGDE